MNNFWDRLGISTSLICVVHCLLTPVVVLFLPLVGSNLVEHRWFHEVIVAIVVPVAIWALWNGYKIHKHPTMFVYAAFGFLFIGVSMALGHDHDSIQTGFMVAAGLLLSYAHYLNLRARRRCAT